ncbi:hypothetical protein [Ruegeria marisflavi]|uniref:hypothetical protein n=1 Tax=Ruegeria marisflavi TaxID=2984152 RepID=UPI0021DF5684|nr:hypothetical protein [Ruegeria sp. WL0004]
MRTFQTSGWSVSTGANGPLLTFITGRDAAMQLTHSGRSCISQHFFDGNDRVADEPEKDTCRTNDRIEKRYLLRINLRP